MRHRPRQPAKGRGCVAARENCSDGAVRAMAAAVIAYFDQLKCFWTVAAFAEELAVVPRANIEFLPIKDVWFSGSMNYV